jgi:hypothetical protein
MWWLGETAPPPAATARAQIASGHSAEFQSSEISADARRLANWVARTGDASNMEYLIIDKKNAKLHVFNADSSLRASSPILIGAAVGDDTVPGIGLRPIADVLPAERTTPAGRFVAQRGHDTRGEDVIWVDYDSGVSIHRVITTNPLEHRLERLATPAIDDKRISYGCINLPVAFYEEHVQPIFATRRAVVYVLPEVKSLEQVFAVSDADATSDAAGPANAPLRTTAATANRPG